jgi:hypothetical protein
MYRRNAIDENNPASHEPINCITQVRNFSSEKQIPMTPFSQGTSKKTRPMSNIVGRRKNTPWAQSQTPLTYSTCDETPVKRTRQPRIIQVRGISPIKDLNKKRFRLLQDLKHTKDFRLGRKLIEEYHSRMKETESWINSKFETVLQSSRVEESSKYLTPSKSVIEISSINSGSSSGKCLKSRIFKRALKSSQRRQPYLSKF